MPATRDLGWYGKLPATGDFVQYRLAEPVISSWSHWLQSGLLDWHSHHASSADFLRAPAWNFILPATLGLQRVQLGVLVPSQDRVGRAWPLLATQSFPLDGWHPAQLSMAGDWFNGLASSLRDAVAQQFSPQQLTDALSEVPPLPMPQIGRSPIMDVLGYQDLPGNLAWPDVARQFAPEQYISYWWTPQNDKQPLKTHRHSGNLTAQLFTLLFNPENGAMAGRSGLYPPMFE